MSEIIVSVAKKEDAEALGKINMQTSKLHFDNTKNEFKESTLEGLISYVEDCIEDENVVILKATFDGEIAGYAIVYFNTYPEDHFQFHKRGYIGGVGVDEKYRRKGVGTALMKGIEEELKKRNVSALELDVYTFNEGAEKFYESAGYEMTKLHYFKVLK